MNKKAIVPYSSLFYLIIRAITVLISGLGTFISFWEYFNVGMLKRTDGYPFGGEGPVPYYYKTPEMYSSVMLIEGIIFLLLFLLIVWAIISNKRSLSIWVLGYTIIVSVAIYIHGSTNG